MLRYTCITLLVLVGAWLTMDGARALLAGDYMTPKSGPYAGQLGPWANLLRAVGIEPRSTAVKGMHVLVGLSCLIAAAALSAGLKLGWSLAFAAAILLLWYLPFGTIVGAVVIALYVTAGRSMPD